MPYCTRDELIDRITFTVLLSFADDDADGLLSESELEASLDRAIAAADAEVDAALFPRVALPVDANDWLTQRAIDIAAEHVAQRKGQAAPDGLLEAAARSRGWLELARQGLMRVPGLSYPDVDRPELSGLPQVVNPT